MQLSWVVWVKLRCLAKHGNMRYLESPMGFVRSVERSDVRSSPVYVYGRNVTAKRRLRDPREDWVTPSISTCEILRAINQT